MILDSPNKEVYSFAATENGVMPTNFGGGESATSYSMTMKFVKLAEFYKTGIYVRAYVKLSDDTVVYSGIERTVIYNIADNLYQNNKMSSKEAHDYLYREILSVVNPDYKEVDYCWNEPIIK